MQIASCTGYQTGGVALALDVALIYTVMMHRTKIMVNCLTWHTTHVIHGICHF